MPAVYTQLQRQITDNSSLITSFQEGQAGKATGKIRDISGGGVFIDVPIRLSRVTSISVKLLLPLELTRVPLELSCKGRVVR